MKNISDYINEGDYAPYEKYVNMCVSKLEPLVSDRPKLKKLLQLVVKNYQSINHFMEPLIDFVIEVEKEHKKGMKVTEEFGNLVEAIQDYADYRFEVKGVYYLTLVDNDYEAVIHKNFPEIKNMQGYQTTYRLLEVMYDRLWDIYERSLTNQLSSSDGSSPLPKVI